MLALARHKTTREIEELIARLRPQPPVPDTIRKLPTRTQALSMPPQPIGAHDAPGTSGEHAH